VKRDMPTAVYWYEQGSKRGNSLCMCLLGSLYENGRGVTSDASLAWRYYNLSVAVDNNPASHHNIGTASLFSLSLARSLSLSPLSSLSLSLFFSLSSLSPLSLCSLFLSLSPSLFSLSLSLSLFSSLSPLSLSLSLSLFSLSISLANAISLAHTHRANVL